MGIERAQGIFVVEGHLSVAALLASPYRARSILVTDAHADRYADVGRARVRAARAARSSGSPACTSTAACWPPPTGRRCPPSEELARRGAPPAGARGGERPREHRRPVPQRGRLRRRRRGARPDRRRPALPAGHPGLARARAAGAVRPGDGLARRARRPPRRPGFTARRPRARRRRAARRPRGRRRPPRLALLVGAEGAGLSAAALAAVDRRVRIPMAPGRRLGERRHRRRHRPGRPLPGDRR